MIRMARQCDAQAISEIFCPIVTSTAISFATAAPTTSDFQKKIAEITTTLPWFVFELDSIVKGFAYASPHRSLGAYRWCVEVSIYVSADSRRSGVAKALYERLIETLRSLGYYNAYAGITLPNEASIVFHEFFGFQKFCVFKSIGNKHGKWHDVAWYKLELQDEYTSNPSDPISIRELPVERPSVMARDA